MNKLIESAIDLIGSLIPATTVTSRRLILCVVIVFLALIFIVFESQTRFFHFGNLERRIAILNELNQLAESGVTDKPELRPIYEQLVNDLVDARYLPIRENFNNFSFIRFIITSNLFWKFISGAAFGLFFTVLLLYQKGVKSASSPFTFGVIFGIVGLFTPNFLSLWMIFGILTAIQILILIIFNIRQK